MGNLTVAVIGSPGYAGDLGKKGTTSDITFYNLKRGDHTVTFLEPARYPERLSSLFFILCPWRLWRWWWWMISPPHSGNA